MNRTAILQSAGRAARAGFTLVELLLVITILGILAGVVTMQLGGHSETARVNATRQSIATIEQAIQIFQIQRSTLPDSLDVLTQASGDAPAPLKKDSLVDSWGNNFSYRKLTKNTFEIRSAGPDGNLNTEDDLVN